MTNNALAKISGGAKLAWNIVTNVGPFAITQSDKMSEAYAKHQLRLASVEACKEYMIQEISTYSDIKKRLLEKYFDATPEDRLRYKRDIEECEREVRKLNTYQKAIEYSPEDKPQNQQGEKDEGRPPISPHWMDKFNEFAKAQNEPWRSELLAKALALEANNPGCIGPRALWLIGTIEEHLFHAYASILDVSSKIASGYMVPNSQTFLNTPIPFCVLGKMSLGNLTFMLSDLGLIGDPLTSQRSLPENARIIVQYGNRIVLVAIKQKIEISGIIPTTLGSAIASLYAPIPNLLGQKIFEEWLNGLDKNNIQLTDIK